MKIGQIIQATGIISDPEPASIPNTFDYRHYLLGENIKKIFRLSNLKIISEPNHLYTFRNFLTPKDSAISSSYLNALIFADKSGISSEVNQSYQINGISHLLAISGMHISCLCLILKKILHFLKFPYPNIFIYFFLLFYLALTNFPPSIIRASLFYFLSTIKLPYISPRQLVIFAILFLLCWQPAYFYNISFQYSAITSFFLIMITTNNSRLINKLLLTSIVAFFASFPITINNFYSINILTIFLNIIFIPLVTYIIYPLTLITFIIPIFNPVYIFCLQIFENLSLFFSKFSFLIINFPKIPYFFIIIYYLIYLNINQNRLKGVITLFIFLIFLKIYPVVNSQTEIYFLDVGQGDATILVSPHRQETILIDTGGIIKPQLSKWQEKESRVNLSQNIITFLKSIGITKIDNLILTHGDYDHLGETINLVNNFPILNVIFNCGKFNELEQEIINVLDSKKISHYSCVSSLNFAKTKLYFINNTLGNDENNNSSVIYTKINDFSFLFMGDASTKVEKAIINEYHLPNISVLKVGHHGSNTSSDKDFINTISPKYSIISVGKNNRYGHPDSKVLNNLKNSQIYRTDLNGSILFKIKKDKLKIKTSFP